MELLYKVEINKILEELGKELDISKKEYESAVKSYEAVGDWLCRDTSDLRFYNPKILPQGSFMLGTVVKPICEEDDIDVDLVCKLERKPDSWTQKDLKDKVGDRLKADGNYDRMIKKHKNGEDYEEGGRRCWTLKYSDGAGYHMDILPSFADENLTVLMEKAFAIGSDLNTDELAIKITDKEMDNYSTDNNVDNWLKSNPFGYAKWFLDKATIDVRKLIMLSESVDPIRAYEKEKLPLQRVVQLLKRHRDIMFSSDEYDSENKPISIIITTLASRAYDKSDNIIDAYTNIVRRMRALIEERVNPYTGQIEKWVPNPVNSEENFADKWGEVKQKEDYFYLWLDKLENDLGILRDNQGKGLQFLNESMSNIYGEFVTNKAFANYGNISTELREDGKRKMAKGTGVLGTIGTNIPKHNFEGYNAE
ncbi:nucleotidyltransferase [Mariniflexile sp. HMF6888]|uniref:nucleotidyltransferase n=1 Tax=Mariniflexile sp. HMF6888 TaxID=3373086 RepID=UPI0037A2345F